MNVLLFIASCLALLSINVSATTAPSTAPSTSPTTSAPTRSPTFRPGFETRVCPTQTFGVDTGNLLSMAADGDFAGTPSNPFMLGRGNITALVHQSTATQKIIVQFAVTFNNNGSLAETPAPNITWNGTRIGMTDLSDASLQAAIYGTRDIAILFNSGGQAWLKTLTVANSRLSSNIATGLVPADFGAHLRLVAGYYIIAASNVALPSGLFDYKIQRTVINSVGGTRSILFFPVAKSTEAGKIPMNMSHAVFESAMEARGVIAMAHPTNFGTQLAISIYNTSSINNFIEHRQVINFITSASADRATRITMVTPAASTFLLAYSDNVAGAKRIYVIYTTNTFTTFRAPELIGSSISTSTPSLSLVWTSNRTINVFEFIATQGTAYALPFLWNRANETSVFNSTYGSWAPVQRLMWNATRPWSRARVSGQTSYGYNFVADTNPAADLQASHCLVYTYVNTTRRSSAVTAQLSAALMAGLVMVAAVFTF